MSKRINQSSVGVLSLLALIMATPWPAHAYVDPGSGTMIWQVLAAAVIGSLFYVRKVFTWVRDHLGFQSTKITGFLFASVFAIIASPVMVTIFDGRPLPRFNDLFVIGIVLTSYLFTWESAVYLLLIALGVSAWVLPPAGSFSIQGFSDWYRIVSFAFVSMFLIVLITRMKGPQPPKRVRETQASMHMHGAAAGAD